MNTCLLLIRWRCLHCRKCISIREGSFFSKSKLTLQKWLILMYWWVREYAVGDASEEAQVTANSAVQVYQWMRDICSTKLLQHPIKLGGPGVVVQIDESLYRHKPKNHRGRATQNEVWVFGLVDTSHTPALGYMQIVPQRDAATLLPIVQAHTLPGTIIHSDEWAAYRRVASLPNVAQHDTVKHSVEFVNSTTGTHPKCRILLEQNQNKIQAHERVPCQHAT